MRILHVIPSVAPRYGGPSSAIVPMCRALADLGAEPTIVATDADGEGRLPVRVGEPTQWHGVPAMFFHRNFSESFKYSRTLASWLNAHARDFDIVHVHGVLSHAPLAASTACLRSGVPYIVRPLGTIARWSLGKKPWRKRALLALRGAQMLRRAAAIHYTSEQERGDAESSLGLSRGIVIPLGIDPVLLAQALVPPDERIRDQYVLALSRLHPKKNLAALIEAFVGATDGLSSWRLVIAGDGDSGYVSSLKTRVEDLGALRRVTFSGWVDGQTKHDLIRRASLFAMPSLDENFGVSLVEALAAGVPALVSRHVHLGRMVSDAGAGWLVEADRESLRTGLLRAMHAGFESEKRARSARALAGQFAWPGVASQLLDLYAEVQRHGRVLPQDAAMRAVAVGR